MSKILAAFNNKKDSIQRIIAKYRSNSADIDELAQDVFLMCYALELKENIIEPEHLLFRVARNLALNQAKKHINKTSVPLPDYEDSPVFMDKDQISVEDQVDAKQKLRIFVEALSALPEEERRIFVMRRVDGLSFAQIATRLSISTRKAERRAASGMLTCYNYLKAHGHDPADFWAAPTLKKAREKEVWRK